MFQNLKARVGQLVAVALVAGLPVVSHAQAAATTFDASTYTAQIVATIAGILAVGGAVFGVYVAIKSTKWARRAL
jgi:hypothetical protein